MNKFRFNTGVNIKDNPNIPGGIDSGNGIIVIPFEADAPKDSVIAFLSDHKITELHEKYIIREIKNSELKSKYVYFKK